MPALGLLVWSLVATSAFGSGAECVMRGEISGIDLAHNTVVVEVPMGSKLFTVGGPLASDAVLKKDGGMAQLGDFSIGERVSVKFRSSTNGHIIERLQKIE